jgi:hypothetical protein
MATVSTVVALSALASGASAQRASSDPGPQIVSQVSTDVHVASGEPWVVTNPRHPNNVVAVWTADSADTTDPQSYSSYCGVAFSMDAGHTWKVSKLGIGEGVGPAGCGDPAIAVAPNGTFYAEGDATVGTGAMYVVRSTDGGRSWSIPVEVFGVDRWPSGTVSNGAPLAAWDRPEIIVDPNTSKVYVSASDDALWGRAVSVYDEQSRTWSAPRPLDPNGQSAWGDVIDAARGRLAAAYVVDPSSADYQLGHVTSCASACVVFETSADDGRSWSRHLVPVRGAPGGAPVTGAGSPRLGAAADPAVSGRYAVLVPTDAARALEVWVTRDSGKHWTRTASLTAEAGQTQSKWWIDYSPRGVLGIVWRTLVGDGTYDVSAKISTDGGLSFGPRIVLTSKRARLTAGAQTPGDDCACNVNIDATSLSTAWPDARTGHRQVYFSRYYFAGSPPAAGNTRSRAGARGCAC